MSRAVAEKLSQRLGQQFVVDNRPRRRRQHRRRSRREVRARRLHADDRPRRHARDQRDALSEARLRSGARFHADHADRDAAARAGRAPVGAGEGREGADRARESAIRASSTSLRRATAARRISPASSSRLPPASTSCTCLTKATPPRCTDLIAGRVQMMFSNMLTSMPHVRAGKLRAIGDLEREAHRRRRPTCRRSRSRALPGFAAVPWYGVLGPPALPKADRREAQRGDRARARAARHERALRRAGHRSPVEHARAVRRAHQDRSS